MSHPLELKIPPVLVVLIFGALMWAGAKLAPALSFEFNRAAVWAIAVGGIGIVVAALGVIQFRRAKTTVNPLKPDTASTFVASGIFRVTRNPMYLGMLLVVLGWALFLRNGVSFLGAAAFVAYMNRFQIEPEERVLFARFGEQFTAYRAQVRRWL